MATPLPKLIRVDTWEEFVAVVDVHGQMLPPALGAFVTGRSRSWVYWLIAQERCNRFVIFGQLMVAAPELRRLADWTTCPMTEGQGGAIKAAS